MTGWTRTVTLSALCLSACSTLEAEDYAPEEINAAILVQDATDNDELDVTVTLAPLRQGAQTTYYLALAEGDTIEAVHDDVTVTLDEVRLLGLVRYTARLDEVEGAPVAVVVRRQRDHRALESQVVMPDDMGPLVLDDDEVSRAEEGLAVSWTSEGERGAFDVRVSSNCFETVEMTLPGTARGFAIAASDWARPTPRSGEEVPDDCIGYIRVERDLDGHGLDALFGDGAAIGRRPRVAQFMSVP